MCENVLRVGGVTAEKRRVGDAVETGVFPRVFDGFRNDLDADESVLRVPRVAEARCDGKPDGPDAAVEIEQRFTRTEIEQLPRGLI